MRVATHLDDAESRVCAVNGPGGMVGYLYDAEGNRVAKGTLSWNGASGTAASNWSTACSGILGQNGWSFTVKASYILGPSGEQLTELSWNSGTQQWSHTNVFAAGSLIATLSPNPNPDAGSGNVPALLTNYYLTDWLGSRRVMTDSNGIVQASCLSLPYGNGESCGTTPTEHLFTGKERDTESGNDYFGARYYASNMGRLMSPDWSATPAAIPFADPSNPQSLNMYSYVTNNPMNRTDPNGHDWFNVNNKWQWQSGSTYHDANGNATKDKGYAGLLVAQANGVDKKTGATTYSLTLYDQNKLVATGSGFSGGNGMASVKDGNYMMRLDIRDPAPNTINANSALGNPPPTFGIQPMQNIPAPGGGYYDVTGAYGPGRVRLNPTGGAKDDGDYFHGQTNGHMWTHGCLCYGADNRFINYMWNNMPHAPMPASIDTPVQKP